MDTDHDSSDLSFLRSGKTKRHIKLLKKNVLDWPESGNSV